MYFSCHFASACQLGQSNYKRGTPFSLRRFEAKVAIECLAFRDWEVCHVQISVHKRTVL